MLRTRILSAMVFAPALLWVIYEGGFVCQAVCWVLSLLMLWELLSMSPADGKSPVALVTYGVTAATSAAILGFIPAEHAVLILPAGILGIWASFLGRVGSIEKALLTVGTMILGVVYCGAMIPYLARIRDMEGGLGLALAALFCTWSGDTGAYFSGRALGKNKLAPVISPKKTIEGAVGGVVAAIAMAFILRHFFMPELAPLHALAVGAIAAVAGIVGDLCESLLKRSTGIKDSSNLIPGHGGVLDRFDGVMFAAPAIFLYVSLVV
ncbi:MAG: phosphatidate cytidylyltransferase [Deltaproteobacteria bacterium]|nr:phosphatidate cytidylyltransferase [Deltaproteobacteria bacterium]MBT6434452.1 phosphatidate cytidylyltransferase [Deltaproteobacteria bacterium]